MITREKIEEMLLHLSTASDRQIDTKVTKDLKELIGKPIPEIKLGIMKALDFCCNTGGASDVAMLVMHSFHEIYLDGKKEDFDNDEMCVWRKNYYK